MTFHRGVWAEFETADGAIEAAKRLRADGYERLDAYTPFPMPELEETLGLPRPMALPVAVFLAAAVGGTVAFLIIWWTAAIAYPLDVGGRPLNSWPVDIPIVFETSILSASLTAFTLALVLSGMPRLDHPLETVPGFERTTVDRFWLGVAEADVSTHPDVRATLDRLGAVRVHDVGEALA